VPVTSSTVSGSCLEIDLSKASARQAATEIVYAVCEQGESLDTALLTHAASLPDRDLSSCRALSYGGVRWYLAYQHYLKQRLKKPFKPKDRILYALLVIALYQLDDTHHAPYAIVNEATELSKIFKRQWASGLVNAILRAYIRESDSRPTIDHTAWNRLAFPAWLVQQFQDAWGDNRINSILEASQAKPPMTLRVNVLQTTPTAYIETLSHLEMKAIPCKDSDTGITLDCPVPVHKLPGFETAIISVQDESAQLVVELLDLRAGQQVLDACAAPGGKSLHILEIEPAIAELSVLDFVERMPRLRENVKRAGAAVNIIEGDLLDPAAWSDGRSYDRILLDVPCTGTGVIRRHPDIKFRRHVENGIQFAASQLEFLNQAWRLLKPGGKLLYTTCSILPAENECCIANFMKQTDNAMSIELPEKLGLHTGHGRQRLPGIHSGDGFFYALIEKN
jgi:16S rRNA (cytosine967-C5)-methyltransferase